MQRLRFVEIIGILRAARFRCEETVFSRRYRRLKRRQACH